MNADEEEEREEKEKGKRGEEKNLQKRESN